jgi:predicted phosphodiesterase
VRVPENLNDALAAEDPAEQRAARYRRERDSLRIQLGQVDAKLSETQRLLEFHDAVARANPEPPKWLTPAKAKKGHRATVVAMLSDTHFDEVVNPTELGGINAYNRDIAVMRLRAWAEGVVKLSRDYLSGVTYDGAVVMLGGDIFSGSIHDELAQTNEDTSFGSLLFWSEQIAAALSMIHAEFGKLHIAAVVGNHGRMTRKPRSKLRARDNLDWLLAHMLARQVTGPGITWDIPDATDAWITVYDTTHLLTHGDQVSGGGGIGGIWSPIMRMNARKAQRYASEGRTFDTVCMGHWHQLVLAPEQGMIVNGSTKGPDEWGTGVMNFRPERPQQAMWLVTPEHGITIAAPVIVADRKKEGW